MRQTLRLGKLFDIAVDIHVSWIVVYALVTSTLVGELRDTPHNLGFVLAALGALLLFASVVAHEFGHALVARRFGVRTEAITLFLFGGVATLESEPPSPRAEIAVAIAGPAVSFVLAALLYAVTMVAGLVLHGTLGEAVATVLIYGAMANAVLGAFNLIPAFPMDGGRVLRAILWRWRHSQASGTAIASLAGLVLAMSLSSTGIVLLVSTREWQYGWYVLMGGFLVRNGWAAYRGARFVERLERVTVGDLMEPHGPEVLAAETGPTLPRTANGLEALAAFRASDRPFIDIVDNGRITGRLTRTRALALAG